MELTGAKVSITIRWWKAKRALTLAVIKIKKALIDKAKLRKEYAKLKASHPEFQTVSKASQVDRVEDGFGDGAKEANDNATGDGDEALDTDATRTPAHLDVDTPADDSRSTLPRDDAEGMHRERFQRQKRAKPMPFAKQVQEADTRRRETEERRQRYERANKERQEKLDERERFRRTMAKARTGGRNGQRKLGRESTVLLEKVQRMMGK